MILALLLAAAAAHATGTFTVETGTELHDGVADNAPAGTQPTDRVPMRKTFTGAMQGTTTGTMVAVGAPGVGFAGYVALDQFVGSVDGRAGTFVLMHRGSMSGSDMTLDVQIAPGSGTGALKGITGTLKITIEGGTHSYDLAYALPR